MSFHHTQVAPAGWGRRTVRATGCAAALLLALTGCFGGSQSTAESSPNPTATASPTRHPLPSSTATPAPNTPTPHATTGPTVTETTAPASTADSVPSASSAVAEAKATPVADASPAAAETPRAPEKVEAERASAGERCGHIGRKGYLKTGAEIMVLRGTVDCTHALDVLTEYVTTPRADDNLTQNQIAKVQDATCYWNPQYEMVENRREDRGAPECTIGEDTAFVARLQNPDAPEIPFLMEPARYDSGAGYYRFKSYDERTVCELNPAESTLACERRLGGQLTDGNGAVGRTFSAPVRITRMNFATGAYDERVEDVAPAALHAESTTANTLMLRPNNVTVFPTDSGKQITCYGEPEEGVMTCHDGGTYSVPIGGGQF